MKKVFALILALCMVFALCACGQTAAPAEKPAADTAADAAPAESTGWAPDGPVTMIVAYAKENTTVASTNGAQASNHLGAQAFANSAEFKYTDLPQGNTADELLSLLGGEADWCVVKAADIAGRTDVKVLASFSEERLPEFPDVPTLGECGYYDKWLGSSRCIVAPAGVSDEVVAFYEAAFKATMEDADYLAAASEFVTDYKDAAATAALIEEQQAFTEGLSNGFWYE